MSATRSAATPNSREETLARLSESRAELRKLFEAPYAAHGGAGKEPGTGGGFPRSRTMRLLTSNRGLKAAAAIGSGLLISRPALLLRLVRLIPVGAVARTVFLKLLTRKGAKS
jgi:hypothetical protein